MRVFKVTFGDEDDVKDLSATSCDLLSKLVEQFHELYNYFDDMFSSDELIKLGVIEVKKIEELELLLDNGLREVADLIADGWIKTYSGIEVKQLIEAKFEKTTLRNSIIKTILKQLD